MTPALICAAVYLTAAALLTLAALIAGRRCDPDRARIRANIRAEEAWAEAEQAEKAKMQRLYDEAIKERVSSPGP